MMFTEPVGISLYFISGLNNARNIYRTIDTVLLFRILCKMCKLKTCRINSQSYTCVIICMLSQMLIYIFSFLQINMHFRFTVWLFRILCIMCKLKSCRLIPQSCTYVIIHMLSQLFIYILYFLQINMHFRFIVWRFRILCIICKLCSSFFLYKYLICHTRKPSVLLRRELKWLLP